MFPNHPNDPNPPSPDAPDSPTPNPSNNQTIPVIHLSAPSPPQIYLLPFNMQSCMPQIPAFHRPLYSHPYHPYHLPASYSSLMRPQVVEERVQPLSPPPTIQGDPHYHQKPERFKRFLRNYAEAWGLKLAIENERNTMELLQELLGNYMIELKTAYEDFIKLSDGTSVDNNGALLRQRERDQRHFKKLVELFHKLYAKELESTDQSDEHPDGHESSSGGPDDKPPGAGAAQATNDRW